MARRPRVAPTGERTTGTARKWTNEELLAVRHLGPGIIGEEMHAAAQAVIQETHGGTLGPAITSRDPRFSQAGPVKKADNGVWLYRQADGSLAPAAQDDDDEDDA